MTPSILTFCGWLVDLTYDSRAGYKTDDAQDVVQRHNEDNSLALRQRHPVARKRITADSGEFRHLSSLSTYLLVFNCLKDFCAREK